MGKVFFKKCIIPLFIVAIMSCFALTSCGDDDKEEPESTSVVGTWRADYEEGYVIYNFKKNGSYSRIDADFEYYGTWSESGTYVVRGDKYITTTTDEGETDTMTILLLDNTTLTVCWEADDVLTFTRQK